MVATASPAPISSTRIRPLAALRGLVAIMRDPQNTEAGAMMVAALTGRSWQRQLDRFRAHPMGARILREGRRLDRTLTDRERLAAMPPGSLGRAYYEWTRDEGIDAQGLLDLPREVMPGLEDTPEGELFAARGRVGHDLWHVVTGYGRDLLGESALLHLTWLQTRNTGFLLPNLLSRLAYLGDPASQATITRARERARTCAWLPAADWEALLERPLGEVRETLGLGAPPAYTPVWERRRPRVFARA